MDSNSLPRSFPCYLVRRGDQGLITAQVETITLDQLPDGDVLIEVGYSSLNYKDALASQGHPGVVRRFPHLPGVDCAGTVVESSAPAGSRVLSVLPPIHVVLVSPEDVLMNHREFFESVDLGQRESARLLVTGPSRTADF